MQQPGCLTLLQAWEEIQVFAVISLNNHNPIYCQEDFHVKGNRFGILLTLYDVKLCKDKASVGNKDPYCLGHQLHCIANVKLSVHKCDCIHTTLFTLYLSVCRV